LAEDNSNLKGQILDLEVEMKVLEKRALDAKASNKLNKEEVVRLEVALVKNTLIDYIEDLIDYIVLERFPVFLEEYFN